MAGDVVGCFTEKQVDMAVNIQSGDGHRRGALNAHGEVTVPENKVRHLTQSGPQTGQGRPTFLPNQPNDPAHRCGGLPGQTVDLSHCGRRIAPRTQGNAAYQSDAAQVTAQFVMEIPGDAILKVGQFSLPSLPRPPPQVSADADQARR